MDSAWLGAGVAAEALSMVSLAMLQRRLLAAGGIRVARRSMLALTYEANAISATLPGGTVLAAGYTLRRLRARGASLPTATFAVLTSGLLSMAAFAAVVLGWAVLAAGDALPAALLGCVPVGVLIGVGVACRDRWPAIARRVVTRVNRIRRRPKESGLDRFHTFVESLRAIRPRRRDWLAGFGHAGVNWLADLACLFTTCNALGVNGCTAAQVAAAYVAGMGASTISVLPAGLGATEAAMVVTLHHGGMTVAAAGSAVLWYRLISVVVVVGIGWLLCATSWLRTRGATGRRLGFPRIRSRRRALSVRCIAPSINHPRSTPCPTPTSERMSPASAPTFCTEPAPAWT